MLGRRSGAAWTPVRTCPPQLLPPRPDNTGCGTLKRAKHAELLADLAADDDPAVRAAMAGQLGALGRVMMLGSGGAGGGKQRGDSEAQEEREEEAYSMVTDVLLPMALHLLQARKGGLGG